MPSQLIVKPFGNTLICFCSNHLIWNQINNNKQQHQIENVKCVKIATKLSCVFDALRETMANDVVTKSNFATQQQKFAVF